MDIVSILIIIILASILILTFYIIGLYNKLIDSRNRVEDQFTPIHTELIKKLNLIPTLVEIIKKYAKHEEKKIEDLLLVKNKLEKANIINNQIKLTNDLNKILDSIYSLEDTYIELKRDKNYQSLIKKISNIEDKIDYAKTFYNDTVLSYNNVRREFPSNIIAKIFKFKQIEYYK